MKRYFDNLKKNGALIHNITNYVTVNDCANILLACGGSPIMADAYEEVEEITSICGGLNINIGTLNKNTIQSMILAGKKSNELNHPVVLDPVGAGASTLRTQTANNLLKEVKFTVIRGNISEIKTLAGGSGMTLGVDANEIDAITETNLSEGIKLAKDFSKQTGAIIAITGAIDIVADSKTVYVIRNGNQFMSKVTGTGCMLSAMLTAFVVANSNNALEATVSAVCTMGLSGELAYERLGKDGGNSTYRNYIIDEVCCMTGEKLQNGAKYEIRN